MQQALYAHTMGSAYASFEENDDYPADVIKNVKNVSVLQNIIFLVIVISF